MTTTRFLTALRRRGHSVSLRQNGSLSIAPKPSDKLLTQIREHKPEIIAELEAERAPFLTVETTERAILVQLASGAITQDEAEAQLTYLFRSTTAESLDIPPCPSCGETIFWWHRNEDDGMEPVCYSCRPPPEDTVAPEIKEAVG